jgi:hypothetical protein
MENPDNEDIIIPVCILLIAAGFSNTEVTVSEDCGLDLGLPGETNMYQKPASKSIPKAFF